MAYNRKNLLKRIIEIQEVFNEHKKPETTNIGIFRKHIEPRWHISYDTFHKYLGIPAKAELKKLEQMENLKQEKAEILMQQTCLNFNDDE